MKVDVFTIFTIARFPACILGQRGVLRSARVNGLHNVFPKADSDVLSVIRKKLTAEGNLTCNDEYE